MLHVVGGLTLPSNDEFEIAEIKGRGHPDSVTDAIADEISRRYSRYCLSQFGYICNHWFDKCVLIGGESEFQFGASRMLSPMKLLVIGKATTHVDDAEIPIETLAKAAADKILGEVVDNYSAESDLVIKILTNNYQGAGRKQAWYRPSSKAAGEQAAMIEANDAVICSGHAPLTIVEHVTLELEDYLFGAKFREVYPFIGSDIKIITQRVRNDLDITACIPFKAAQCPSRLFYDSNLAAIKRDLEVKVKELCNLANVKGRIDVHLNTRDTSETVYMSHYGSCLDTGDVGAVGRGNRTSGLITPSRPMSIEAPAGKNPRYHSGKVLDIAAKKIADALYETAKVRSEVTISTQTGRSLTDPFCTIIQIEDVSLHNHVAIQKIASDVLEDVRSITKEFVHNDAGT